MKHLRKKGQTEDFIADLIPSLIIIGIGLYFLSNTQNSNEQEVNDVKTNLTDYLKDGNTMADYLEKQVSVGDKKMPLKELISLSYKNEEYQQKAVKELEEITKQDTGRRTIESCIIITCLNAEIQYPDGSSKKIKEDIFCPGEKKSIFFPTYEGQSIKMIFQLGVTVSGSGCVG